MITHALAKSMGIEVTGIFKPCKECALGKAKMGVIRKKAVAFSIFLKRLFFNISFPSTPTFGGKKHWLLIVEDNINYMWSYF